MSKVPDLKTIVAFNTQRSLSNTLNLMISEKNRQKVFLLFVALWSVSLLSSCHAQSLNKEQLKNSFLVDVRTPEEFSEGSAPGAVNIPLHEIPNRLNEFKGKKHIVVFCRSGNRSAQAQRILKENGFNNVINGGSWQAVANILDKNSESK
ncbi:MAG: rhodanese-like domain-containing protein [Chitinophagales bacterium]|nr:rhodanese-like domain-containing protein [Chitinophagales bacterium]MDW8272975.1 rhodanese-like domain-containing protein [Chitinophagales bacterium]